MESLKELYKVGSGPSSSHTMGPQRAAKIFKSMVNAKYYKVYLYGSLAATGKGHFTDYIIKKELSPIPVEFIWDAKFIHKYHTNYLKFEAYNENDIMIKDFHVFSIGGGSIRIMEDNIIQEPEQIRPYTLSNLTDIIAWCKKNNKELWEYVEYCEGPEIWDHLKYIYESMKSCIKEGIQKDGLLPSKLRFERKAKKMYENSLIAPESLRLTKKMFSYALATSEQNASGCDVVTAPTCGACGVLPAVLIAMVEEFNLSITTAIRGLAVAGIIGLVIKTNATVSGAEGGCQAEIGSACSMASSMAAYFLGSDLDEIEYAAESGMEHALGMTCDPIGGYVIVPCIERNAVFSVKALNTANYVRSVGADHIISFDEVVKTMYETGKDLATAYKETSDGGLAKYYEKLLKEQKKKGLKSGEYEIN